MAFLISSHYFSIFANHEQQTIRAEKMKKNLVLIAILLVLGYSSCSQHEKQKTKNPTTDTSELLSFSSIDKKDIDALGSPFVDSATISTIRHFYRYFWEGNDLWGEFLVAQGNQILFEQYRGFSNYQDSALINSHTPIHLASISKNLTAMVVLKLVEKKKLKLQDSVYHILEKFPYKNITIFDLLTHRSGLGNYDHYAEEFGWVGEGTPDFTNQRMYEMYAECEPSLLFKPNTLHSYCNANYAFLALVVEKLTQKPFPQVMSEMLFQPLQMKDTYIFTKAQKDTATLSYYYNKKPWKWDAFDYIYGDKNVYSTARDLFKYSEAMFTDNFLPKRLLDSAMHGYSYENPGVKNYGLGFRLREFDNGKKVVFHTGKWHGNNTLFMHLPDEKLTIIALGNRLNRANYSAFTLVSLFGDYPLELEAEDELLKAPDTSAKNKLDSLTNESKIKWKNHTENQIKDKKEKEIQITKLEKEIKVQSQPDSIIFRKPQKIQAIKIDSIKKENIPQLKKKIN